MKVLVTGAAGFLGSALVRELKKQGYYIRALIRRKESAFRLQGLEVEIFICNILDKERLKDAVREIDVIFHTAALVNTWYPFYQRHPRDIYKINVEGTRNVMESAYKVGVKKVIYTSSIATVGKRPDGKPSDESVSLNLFHKRTHYEKSKALAEDIVLSYHNKGIHVVAINPGFLIGIGDSRPTDTGETIISFLNRAYPCYFDGIIYVTALDVAVEAHIKAMEKGKSGGRYIVIDPHPFTIKEIFDALEKITGIKGPCLKCPFPVLYLFSILNETILLILCLRSRFHPLIGSEAVKYLMLRAEYDGSKARKEFGLKDKAFEEALKAEVDWYMSNGYIRRSSRMRYYKKLEELERRKKDVDDLQTH